MINSEYSIYNSLLQLITSMCYFHKITVASTG